MKKISALLIPFAMIAATALSQPDTSTDQSTSPNAVLVGIWQGQREAQPTGLPFVTLTITNEGGYLSGAILHYVIRLENGKPVASEPGIPEPILNPTFDGQTLTFLMKYRGPLPKGISSGDPLLRCRLKLTPPNKADLVMGGLVTDAQAITGSPLPLGPPVQMLRTAN